MNAKELGLQSAFPGQYLNAQGEPAADYECGLTKREQFAAMAMQGMCAGATPDYSRGPCNAAIAARAIMVADVLLAALAGEQP